MLRRARRAERSEPANSPTPARVVYVVFGGWGACQIISMVVLHFVVEFFAGFDVLEVRDDGF